MRGSAYIVAIGAVIGLCLWLYFALKPDPVVIEPAGQPREVPAAPPIVEDDHQVVFSDSTGEKENVPVPDAGDVAVAVTIEDDSADGEPLRLLVDAPKPRWFPEFSLVRSPIGIRTVQHEDARRVTLVYQRLAIFDAELVPLAGIGYDSQLTAAVGVTFVRIWFVHLGGGIVYRTASREIAPIGLVLVEVRDHLFAGATLDPEIVTTGAVGGLGAVVAYRF